MNRKYDFAGWVTKNDILCNDGVVIKQDAFKEDSGKSVPLVWQHDINNPANVLGRVFLENRDLGVYGYGYFNDSESAKDAKHLVQHGDIVSMSINANKIKKQGKNVVHGKIREVSLVLAGANPGAMIEHTINHSDDSQDLTSGTIYNGLLIHSADDIVDDVEDEVLEPQDQGGAEEMPKTIEEVIDTLTDEQAEAVMMLLDADAEEGLEDPEFIEQGEELMRRNVFDNQGGAGYDDVLTHDDMGEILGDAIKLGSLKGAYLQHGITNIEILFPDAKTLQATPHIYKDQNRKTDEILGAVHKSPFSRVKTIIADLTDDDARAKGYIKGNEKLEQVFPVMKRITTPQTIYKKQKLDRDDIIDIEDFDVVSFINGEMRMMLNEEIARAILVGDGRAANAEDKINPEHIRPIISDHELYAPKFTVKESKDLVEAVIKDLGDYQGSGLPTVYLHPSTLADLKLLKDTIGRFLYETEDRLASRMGVAKFVPTTFMGKNQLIVTNLSDYTLGASKGGEVTTFDDFDIDFNQYKYLIETRISGALTIPKSALVYTIDPNYDPEKE